MPYSADTLTEIPVGTRVQVWDNLEIGNRVGVVTADNGTGDLVVYFDFLDDERAIPRTSCEHVRETVAYEGGVPVTRYHPTDGDMITDPSIKRGHLPPC